MKTRKFLGIVAPAAIALTVLHDVSGATPNVLFVGNSFTHGDNTVVDPVSGSATTVYNYNKGNVTDLNSTSMGGMPGIFKAFTLETGLSYNVSIEAVSNETLQWHEANESAIIGQSTWNTVVLQDYSTNPLPDANGGNRYVTHAGVSELRNTILSADPTASILLDETWAYPAWVGAHNYSSGLTGLDAMQSDLDSGIADAYTKYGLTGVARVGEAFQQALDSGYADPTNTGSASSIRLYKDDTKHAGVNGMFLAAAVMYAKITGNDPRKIPTGVWDNTGSQDLYVDSTDAANLFQIAYNINALGNPNVGVPLPGMSISASGSYLGTSRSYSANTGSVSGAASMTSITTAEGTFTNLVGANTNSTATGTVLHTGSVAPTASAAVQGLTLNDGVGSLTTGDFQFSTSAFTASTRFFLVDSDPDAYPLGHTATIHLIDSNGNTVGSYTLNLQPSDFTASVASNTSDALALIQYTGQSSQWKLGAVSFSLADLGITDPLLTTAATGLSINGNGSLNLDVVGVYTVPEPFAASLAGITLLALGRARGFSHRRS